MTRPCSTAPNSGRVLLLEMSYYRVNVHSCWLDSVEVNAIPVQVIGWQDEGVWDFPDLAAAQKIFPALDPYRGTSRFTAAMCGEVNNAPALRFETWAAYEVYSTDCCGVNLELEGV